MRDYYFTAELQNCQPELKMSWFEGELMGFTVIADCVVWAQVWQNAFRPQPLTFLNSITCWKTELNAHKHNIYAAYKMDRDLYALKENCDESFKYL